MIEIGRLPNERAAQALVDYLKGQDIVCLITPTEDGVAISVQEDRHAVLARQEFHHFIHHPFDDKYLQASWEHGDTQTRLDYGSPSLALLAQFITAAGPLTLVVFFACVAIFAAMSLGLANPVFELLSFFGAVPLSDVGQLWRLFTPSLMHFSLMHLAFNLLWWWYLGGKIENRLGLTPLAILLLIGGTLPNALQYFMAGPNFGGLSGVVYALVGYTWLMGVRRPAAGIGLPPAYMMFMLLWLALGFTDLLGISMANGAHLGGLFVGLAQGWFDSRRQSPG